MDVKTKEGRKELRELCEKGGIDFYVVMAEMANAVPALLSYADELEAKLAEAKNDEAIARKGFLETLEINGGLEAENNKLSEDNTSLAITAKSEAEDAEYHVSQNIRLEAENAKLRAALEKILNDTQIASDKFTHEQRNWLRAIETTAREALGKE